MTQQRRTPARRWVCAPLDPTYGSGSSAGVHDRLEEAAPSRSVPREPLPGLTLRRRDLDARHLVRNLHAVALGVGVAAHRREIEPLVRLDEIKFHIPAYAIHKAELEKSIWRRAVVGALLNAVR